MGSAESPGPAAWRTGRYVGAMPTILDRDTTVELLREEYHHLADVCTPLDAAQWDTPTCLPGWTVRDVLSHVIGVEAGLLGDAAPPSTSPTSPT